VTLNWTSNIIRNKPTYPLDRRIERTLGKCPGKLFDIPSQLIEVEAMKSKRDVEVRL
jgi:hypothetical protein